MSEINIPDDHQIHPAEPNELSQVSRILGSAFAEDPVFNWFCQAEPEFYGTIFHSELEGLYRHHEHVFINRSHTGAAMWLPPGVSTAQPFRLSDLGLLAQILFRGGFKSLSRGDFLQETMARVHMKEPHYYLHAIGAMQGCQGRGIGSALLKHGVRLCDEAGYPAYLESSNIRNNPLYERYGFEVTEEITLPEGGPSFWLMQRPAP